MEKENKLKDFYFKLMAIGWGKYYLAITLAFFAINIVFAATYFFFKIPINNASPESFLDYFFFSIQTVSTIGYGHLTPVEPLSNILASIEAVVGIIFVALVTGITFSKFSRPNSKLIFSRNIITTKMDGKDYLAFRIGNKRQNDLVDTQAKIVALVEHTTEEGEKMRKMIDLELVRDHTPFLNLSWTVFHPLDNSPVDLDRLLAISCLVIGHDGTYSQTVYSRKMYYPNMLVKESSFKDIISISNEGKASIDFKNFHTLKN